MPKFDSIICGAGVAGLSLYYYLKKDNPSFNMLLIDKRSTEELLSDERVFSFWCKDFEFPKIARQKWSGVKMFIGDKVFVSKTKPYDFFYMRAKDFYSFVLKNTDAEENLVCGEIDDYQENSVRIGDRHYFAKNIYKSFVLSSCLKVKTTKNMIDGASFTVCLKKQSFDTKYVVFMDFRNSKIDEFLFFYLLPLTKKRAIVEVVDVAGINKDQSWYKKAVENYIHNYYSKNLGSINQNYMSGNKLRFVEKLTADVNCIGGAAGTIDPMTGYGFVNSLKHSKSIAKGNSLVKEISTHKYNISKTAINFVIKNPSAAKKILEKSIVQNGLQQTLSFVASNSFGWNNFKYILRSIF